MDALDQDTTAATHVESELGLHGFFVSGIAITMSALSAKALIEAFVLGTRTLDWLGAATLTVGLSFFAFGVGILLTRHSISLEGVTTHTLLGQRHLSWQRVGEIRILPIFFNIHHHTLLVTNDGGKGLFVATGHFHNGKEVIKAIIEAGVLSNKNIELNHWARQVYGPPPHGIFSVESQD